MRQLSPASRKKLIESSERSFDIMRDLERDTVSVTKASHRNELIRARERVDVLYDVGTPRKPLGPYSNWTHTPGSERKPPPPYSPLRSLPGADSAPLLSSARKGLKSRSTHPAGKRTYVPHSPIGNQRLYVLIRTVLLLVPYLLTSLQ